MLLNMLVTAGAVSPSSGSGTGVTMHGEDAFKLLIGNTLLSIGEKGTPTYRYFMNEHLEYRCLSIDLSSVSKGEKDIYAGASGCELYFVSLRNGRLCESSSYLRCQDHELTLTLRPRSRAAAIGESRVLGHISLPTTDNKHGADPIDHDLIKGDYDLVRGNATIFPDFNPVPQPQLIQPKVVYGKFPSVYVNGCRGERRLSTLTQSDAISKLVGNTLVLLDRDGKFDGRTGEYFDPKGGVVSVTIPKPPPEGSSILHPTSDIYGGIFINRWKVENGELCRTLNDAPAKFLCGTPPVVLQKPAEAGTQVAPRFCAGDSFLGEAFVAKGMLWESTLVNPRKETSS
jgi:hypothetical protein